MTVGKRIRAARKAAGLTQVDTAEIAEIAVNSLRLYEADKRVPNLRQLQAIARALNVEWPDLVPEENPRPSVVDRIPDKLKDTKSPVKRIDAAMAKLNDDGINEAVKRVEELTEIPRYQRQDAPTPPPDDTPADTTQT